MPVEQTRTLYTLAELRELVDRPAQEQDDTVDSRAFQHALDKVREWSWELCSEDLLNEIDLSIAPEIFGKAGITFSLDRAEWDADRGWFRLPRNAQFNTEQFLRAVRAYWAGVDYRGPDYRKLPADQQIVASPRERTKLDLRSKAARNLRDSGLGFADYGHELDYTYHYEVSHEWRDYLNDFLTDIEAEAGAVLTKELDYLNSEERLLEFAEMNEYLFTRMGWPA